jgi:hypothetical protein
MANATMARTLLPLSWSLDEGMLTIEADVAAHINRSMVLSAGWLTPSREGRASSCVLLM